MRSDFFFSKLKEFVINLADLSGHYKPVDFLNELIEEAETYGSEFQLYVISDLHGLIQQHSDLFWNKRHREEITKWFNQYTAIENQTWPLSEEMLFVEPFNAKTPAANDNASRTRIPLRAIHLIHYYNGEEIKNKNKQEIAERYGWPSGESLIKNYHDTILNSRRGGFCIMYEKEIMQSGLLKDGEPSRRFEEDRQKAHN